MPNDNEKTWSNRLSLRKRLILWLILQALTKGSGEVGVLWVVRRFRNIVDPSLPLIVASHEVYSVLVALGWGRWELHHAGYCTYCTRHEPIRRFRTNVVRFSTELFETREAQLIALLGPQDPPSPNRTREVPVPIPGN